VTARHGVTDLQTEVRCVLNNLVAFTRRKYPYLLGFGAIEAAIYYFDGPTGNFTTGFLGLFIVWIYYSWMSKA